MRSQLSTMLAAGYAALEVESTDTSQRGDRASPGTGAVSRFARGAGLAALASLLLLSRAAAANNPGPPPPPDGPYIISGPTYTAHVAGPVTHYKIAGRVNSVSGDSAGYYGSVLPLAAFTGTIDIELGTFTQPATWQTHSYACGNDPAANICDCACYYPTGSGFEYASAPGTATCPSTSYAKSQYQLNHSCTDFSTFPLGGTYTSEHVLPGSAGVQNVNGFTLTFADAAQTVLSQDPSQSMVVPLTFATSFYDIKAGHPIGVDPFVTLPDSTLVCSSQSSFCSGASTVDILLPGGQNPLPNGQILISYAGGSLRLIVEEQWVPGLPDPGGPMVWQNTWKLNTQYNANNVVNYNGVTYLAKNSTFAGPNSPTPDQNLIEWIPIGSSASGAPGPAGPPGAQGLAGAQGQPGAQGPPGALGAAGATGVDGAAGPAGPQGPAGAQGPTGPQGPASLTWIGEWLSTNQYLPGDAVAHGGSSFIATTASYNSAPSSSSVDWKVLALAGDPGVAGPPGAAGAQGPAGPQGASGKNLVNLPGSIATFNATAGCPTGSTVLGSSSIFYLSSGHIQQRAIVYCGF